jgi:hypothetical protein
VVQLLVIGNGADSLDTSGIRAWTLKNGQLTGVPVEISSNATATEGRVVTLAFKVPQGDDLTLLSYTSGGMTKYVWLRPRQVAS